MVLNESLGNIHHARFILETIMCADLKLVYQILNMLLFKIDKNIFCKSATFSDFGKDELKLF